MWGNTEISVVIYGSFRACYLCFTNTLVFIVSLVLGRQEREREPNHRPTFSPYQVLVLPSVREIKSATMS